MGLACSECFSGKNLYRILKPGFDFEARVMERLVLGNSAPPLSTHTSAGVSPALADFVVALEKHLPWKNMEEQRDWLVSLQLEGASAVMAAIDLCMQTLYLEEGNKDRMMIAVGGTSYHGPPSTSFGAKCPLFKKANQLMYPVPQAGMPFDEADLETQFVQFLDKHAHKIAVMLFEPQWGSSQAGYPWPKVLLKKFIALAKARGIKVICDEIMCGMGRHGTGTLFVSESWDLDPDAVTFGKSIGAGVYPISGTILKKGRTLLNASGSTVMQSHTYSGASTRALMAATGVLNEIPKWFPIISQNGKQMECIFHYLNEISKGMLVCHGLGLMWGAVFSTTGQNSDKEYRCNATAVFKKHCDRLSLVPYHVPVGGFMLSPVFDIDVSSIYEVGEKLEEAVKQTMLEVQWKPLVPAIDNSGSYANLLALAKLCFEEGECEKKFHETKTCTSCSTFVGKATRTRFTNCHV